MTSDREPGAISPGALAARLDLLTTIVSRAAAAILAIAPAALAARQKSDRSPVTAADEAAEALILEGLARVAPGLAVVSEEASAHGHTPAIGPCFILVDPLDGTREFLAGRDEFTVNLAVIADGVPVIGLVAAPALGVVWRGVVGGIAERLRLDPGAEATGAREVALIRTRAPPPDGLVAAVSRSHFDERTAAFLKSLKVAREIECGSSVKFCRIAEGAADVYPRLGTTCEWDIAAGHAILKAAGGAVTTPEGGPLIYGHAKDGFRVPGFIAWGDPGATTRRGCGPRGR